METPALKGFFVDVSWSGFLRDIYFMHLDDYIDWYTGWWEHREDMMMEN